MSERSRNWKANSPRVEDVLKTCTQAVAKLPLPEQFRVLAGLRAYVNTPTEMTGVPDDETSIYAGAPASGHKGNAP